jgi:two-component system alkaline phosphatase synthesis response regulator PhoP
MSQRILIVEDEASLVMTLTDRLQRNGYEVDSAADGEAGLQKALTGTFDLLLLDVMLPLKSGLDICRKVRQNALDTPILMLTARGQTIDKVTGLQFGADDYLTKPFDMMELEARIEALLRRAAPKPAAAQPSYTFGDIHIDFRSAEVTRGSVPVAFTAREFHLLRYLVEHRGATISREELLTEVWGYDAMTSTRTVDVHVAWLRQKIEENPKFPVWVLTVRGMGYKFTG